jgi:hypothetical protein
MKAKPQEKPSEPIPEDTALLNDIEVEKYLRDAVRIEPLALEEEFIRLPADIAYWNERHARALREYLEAKIARERTHGELMCDPKFYEHVEVELGKKPTVEQMKGATLSDERYIASKVRENIADVERQRLRGCVEALSTKRDMLISLGAHVRLEMMHDPVVRRNMSRLRDVDSYGTPDDDSDSDSDSEN